MIGQPGMHPYSERSADLYETPREATEALLRAEMWLPSEIWEPCAGRGAISRVLKEAGHNVLSSDICAYEGADHDIATPFDFLKVASRLDGKFPGTKIVTNPPFKLANQFIRHALKLDCDTYVLLRLMALEGAGRSDLIDKHLRRVWVGIERLPPMHREGWAGAKVTSSPVAYAWFCFSPKPRPAGSPAELRRISWRAPKDEAA
jgi:hypothetical protein